MYNAASSFSNNPFIDDPTNSASRFPDIGSLERSSSGYTSPGPSSGYSYPTTNYPAGYAQPQQSGYGIQPQPQQYLQAPQVQQQQQPYNGWQQPQGQQSPYGGYGTPTGYGSGPISPAMTGMPYGGDMPQQYSQQSQYSGYSSPQYSGGSYSGYVGQQGYGGQSQPPSSALEFDPLRPQNTSSNSGLGPGGQMHPKEYIRTHKQELEMWDNVTWKQTLGTFDSLRTSWETHKVSITMRLQQGGYYLGPMESQRLQGLQREAENNIDRITASSVQMQEVLNGYRQSADLASKNRVRESLNAAVVGLPYWPPQNW